MNDLWVDTYSPSNINDIYGNKGIISTIDTYISSLKEDIKINKNILISGDTGIGKTSIAKILLEKNNYRVIEFNATNINGSDTIKNALRNSLYHENILEMFNQDKKRTAVLIDEFDSLISMGTKGGMTELLTILKKSKSSKKSNDKINTPIIFTCRNIRHSKITDLRKLVKEFKLKALTKIDKSGLLKKIIEREKIQFDFDALQIYIKSLDDDIRNIINNFQYLCNSNKHITIDNINILINSDNKKDKDEQLYDGINKIFFKKNLSNYEVESIYELDTFFVPLLIHENYVSMLSSNKKNNKTSKKIYYKQLTDISSYIVEHDIINKHIFNECCWEIQQYIPYIHTKPINNILSDFITKPDIQIKWTTLFGNISSHCKNLKKGISFAMNLERNILKYYDAIQLLKMAKYFIIMIEDYDTLVRDILLYYDISFEELELLFKLDQKINKLIKKSMKTKLKKSFKKFTNNNN